MNRTPTNPLTLLALVGALAACGGPAEDERAPETTQDSLLRFQGKIGRANRGYKLHEKAIVDTDLAMTEFFGAPFTISGWVMPEFAHGYYGPILAESGGGYFVVGQGDYRKGDGDYKKVGSPVLYMKVGQKSATYLAPGFDKRGWNHIAVVRTNPGRVGAYSFLLYLDGQLLTPVTKSNGVVSSAPQITFSLLDPISTTDAPQGHLRFGRRTSGQNRESSKTWQYFGMLDEVAVYDVAKTPSQVLQMAGQTRLYGNEADLLAGWTFDDFESLSYALLPAALKRPLTDTPTAYRIPLSWPRETAADAYQFDNPFLVGPTTGRYKLPFPKDEIWRVLQPMDAAGGSHNGYAGFSMDFSKVSGSGSAYAEVTSVATGQIIDVNETFDPDPNNPREPYTVKIQAADREIAGYLHLEYGSWTDVFLHGNGLLFHPQADLPWTWRNVSQGDPLARLGPVAAHLHYGMTSHHGVRGQFPATFEAYWASDDFGNTWHYVYRGYPKADQYLKRTQ